jgi:predicted dehydrogenase
MNPLISTRRRFMKTTAAIAAAVGLPEWFVRREALAMADEARPAAAAAAAAAAGAPSAGASAAPASAPTTQPKLPVVLIGCGGRGTYVCGTEAAKHVQVLAVCDVDEKNARSAANKFKTDAIYSDFRKAVEHKGIKAVVNATPDHWHTLINIHALRQGKDVYSEKPLTLTIEEGQKLIAVVKETKGILQTGSQQRSDPKFRLACELVRNGRIGKLTHISTVVPTGAQGGPFKPREAPEGMDWDFWQGQAPRREFHNECIHGLFRWWWEYSEGTITDWGAHHHDIALWGLGLDPQRNGPTSIDGRGIGDPVKGGFTTFPSFYIEYTYANGVTHTSVAIPQTTPPYATDMLLPESERAAYNKEKKSKVPDKGWRNCVRFEGTDGSITVSRGRIEASRKELLDEPLSESAVRLYKSNDHFGNFVECIKTRQQPICPAEIGHRSASHCHLGAISCRLDRKLFWDPEKEEFANDEPANAMRSRPMHEPWGYDQV